MWTQPITDRTALDVFNKTSKGYLNIEDLNRIGGNIAELSNLLELDLSPVTNWTRSMYITLSDMSSIISDVNSIKSAYPVTGIDATPANPLNTYEKINTIERILLKTYTTFRANQNNNLVCGDGYCNDIGLL